MERKTKGKKEAEKEEYRRTKEDVGVLIRKEEAGRWRRKVSKMR